MFVLLGILFVLPWLPLGVPVARNLEYEYASLLSITMLLLAMTLPWLRVIAHQLVRLRLRYVILASPLLIAPAASLWSIGLCLCSTREGLLWLLVQVVPSYFVAVGVAMLLARLKLSASAISTKLFATGALTFALFIVPLLILWFLPQKRLNIFAVGYFHGPIYDAWLPIDLGILLSRCLHLTIGMLLIYCCLKGRDHIKVLTGLTLVLALSIANQIPLPFLSSGSGARQLEQVLDQQIQGDGYTLHHSADLAGSKPQDLLLLQKSVDFHLADLAKYNSLEDEVAIYVYDSSDQKKLLFGGGLTDVTDVVTPSVHLLLEPWPHSTLRHELVHAITSETAYFGLGFHPNMAFTEGLATALAPQIRDLSLTESALSLKKQDKLPLPSSLFTPLFWMESGRIAYRTAGAFLDYVRQQYGSETLMRLYRGEPWAKVYSDTLPTVWQTWRQGLESEDASPTDIYGEAAFRASGVLADRCPHSKASLLPSRSQNGMWLRQPAKSWQDYYEWRLLLDPDDRRSKLALAKINSGSGKGQLKPQRFTHIEDYQLALDYLDSLILNQDLAQALGFSREISSQIEGVFLGYNLHRNFEIRRILLNTAAFDSAGVHSIIAYLKGQSKVAALPKSDNWLIQYLKVRQPSEYNTAADLSLLLSEELPATVSRNLRFEWFAAIGKKAVRHSHFNIALAAFNKAKESAHPGAIAAVDLYLREILFYQKKI